MQSGNTNNNGAAQTIKTGSSLPTAAKTTLHTSPTKRYARTSMKDPFSIRRRLLYYLLAIIIVIQFIFFSISNGMIDYHIRNFLGSYYNTNDIDEKRGGKSHAVVKQIIYGVKKDFTNAEEDKISKRSKRSNSSNDQHYDNGNTNEQDDIFNDLDDGIIIELGMDKSKYEKEHQHNQIMNQQQQHQQKPTSNFTRYDKVAIVTKVHWSNDVSILKRMLCLFNAAYNQYVNYDIIVFTTIPWPKWKIDELQSIIPDSKLKVVIDGPSPTGDINDYIVNMTQNEISTLEERCGGKPLDWFNHCSEEGMEIVSNLAYNWQSEFRSYHIYIHDALRPYKYMIWMDSDALCTQPWTVDPMKLMVENELTVMFPNFPAGKTEHPKLRAKIEATYNQSICHAILNKEGFLWGKKCSNEDDPPHFQHIHGFHHVTNLDVYRKDIHLKFLRSATVGEYKFSRLWDDQLCVTVPAVMDEPGKAWDYWKHNITTNIFHHGDFDGKGRGMIKRFKKWWKTEGSRKWKEGKDMCDNYVNFVKD